MASPVLQILTQAQAFQQQFAAARKNLNRMAPSAQEDVPAQLKVDTENFLALQEKVETFLRQHGTIPGARQDQFEAVCTALNAAAADLDIIQINGKTAAQYGEIAAKVDALYNASPVNQSQVATLERKINELTKNRYLNQGNREAYEVLSAALQTYHNQPITPSSVFAPDADRRGTIGATDVAFDVSLFLDQYKELKQKLCQDPIKDFETVLPYYRELKKYSLSLPAYASQEVGQTIAAKLQETENFLKQCIDTQSSKEQEQVQKAEAQAEKEKAEAEKVKVLTDCHSEIVTLAAGNGGVLDLSQVNTAYAKLQNEDKEKFIISLRGVLKINISFAHQSKPIADIPGTWQQKKEAMQNMIPPATQTTAANLDLKGPSMTAKFNEVKNMQLPPAQIPAAPLRQKAPQQYFNPSSQPHFPAYPPRPSEPPPQPPFSTRTTEFPTGMYLPDEIDISELYLEDVIPSSSAEVKADIDYSMEVIHKLQALAVSLEENGSSYSLKEVCTALQIMESEGHKCTFRITDKKVRLIADRPCYHLFLIHKNETPDKLIDDPQYGNKAFGGIYPATNEERRRSVQRTIVELVLENLVDAINFGSNKDAIEKKLKILDDLKLDAKDCPQEKNISHLLAEFFYETHKQNRKFDTTLIDPDDAQFNYNFGRVAFSKSMQGIEPPIKISAIYQVRNALKTAWKVE